jgi:hypothetical protein
MTTPSRDYHAEYRVHANSQRDSDSSKLTHADRARINKAWNRAVKLGAMKVVQIEMRRNEKRGFELS